MSPGVPVPGPLARDPAGLLAGLWALGASLLAARVVWNAVRFRRALRSTHVLDSAEWRLLLGECRRRLGVRREIQAYEAAWIRCPAVCGWWRPRLLLPCGFAHLKSHALNPRPGTTGRPAAQDTGARLSAVELRHVVLHELAHVRRGDVLVNWLATAAQALHWFNPAVWLVMRRMRTERELAADHLALLVLGEAEARAYGQTMLKLLAGFARSVATPAVVGILEDHGALRERIQAIARFRQPARSSALAVLLAAGLAGVTLTDARPRPAEAAAVGGAAAAPSTATERRTRLHEVAAQTSQPLARAGVRLQVTDAQGAPAFSAHRTDREARVTPAASEAGWSRSTMDADQGIGPESRTRLARKFLLRGRVTEAESGRPVTTFRLVRGSPWRGVAEEDTEWAPEAEEPNTSADGVFSVQLEVEDPQGQAIRFMAVAQGYLPEASPVFEAQGSHEHTFQLRKGEGPRGLVLGPEGRPVANVEVGVVGFGRLSLHKGTFREPGCEGWIHLTTTDAEGRFALPALLPAPRVVATHPDHGFAEVAASELAAEGRITLLRWGRIEGVMHHGPRPAVGREVALVNPLSSRTGWRLDLDGLRTRTDAAGRFTMEQVPPGERQLVRPMPFGSRGWSWSHLHQLTVEPGTVTRVVYGGTGRPVTGKVVLAAPKREIDWRFGHHALTSRFPSPPETVQTPEAFRAWQESAEFKEAMGSHRSYAPDWQADGSFRIEDVVPGRYDLHLSFLDPANEWSQPPLGSITREIRVPDITGGQTDEPFDLGELTLVVRSRQESTELRRAPTQTGNRPAAAAAMAAGDGPAANESPGAR